MESKHASAISSDPPTLTIEECDEKVTQALDMIRAVLSDLLEEERRYGNDDRDFPKNAAMLWPQLGQKFIRRLMAPELKGNL